MTLPLNYAGCDVSKAFLDLAIIDGERTAFERRFTNDPAGVRALTAALRRHHVALTVFEPSGGYERVLAKALDDGRLPARRMNARQIRDFARGLGLLAKTDRIDARVLARYACAVRPEARPGAPEAVRELRAWTRRRRQLVETRKREKQRLSNAEQDLLRRDIEDEIERLSTKIGAIEQTIRSLIERDPDLKNRSLLLGTLPGFGPASTANVLAETPELGSLTGKAAANLLGVAPHACDSGAMRGRRRCYGGRKTLRDALYMASLSAIRSTQRWRRLYERLREAGKPHKVALIAVMRRLFETANAMLRDNKPFELTAS